LKRRVEKGLKRIEKERVGRVEKELKRDPRKSLLNRLRRS
jgi:hypothetical protein